MKQALQPEQRRLALPTMTVATVPPAPEPERPAPTASEPETGEIRRPREESEYRSREIAPETAETEGVHLSPPSRRDAGLAVACNTIGERRRYVRLEKCPAFENRLGRLHVLWPCEPA
jgi:hypothetical protein